MITILIALVLIALVTVFSVQNASPVIITFIYWKFEASLAIVVFLSALAGVLIAMIGMASRRLRRSRKQGKKEGKPPEVDSGPKNP
ncbi:MAG: LapA family protein [Candidatus Sulfobium sp.]